MGWTQPVMAKKLGGLSTNYIGMLENGQKPGPALEKLFDMIEKENQPSESPPTSPHEAMKRAREGRGLDFKELAKLTKYPADALQRLENGDTKQASEKMLRAVAKALHLDPEILLDGSEETVVREGMEGTFGATPDMTAGPGVGRPKFVPFISMAQAGTMSGNVFTDGGYTYEGTVAFDPEDRRAFGVKIVGDSMAPDYKAGDIVIAYPSFPAQNNKLVICRLLDGEVLFKIYQTRDNGRRVVLSSYNPAFPPVDIEREQFAWIYPVKGLSRRLD